MVGVDEGERSLARADEAFARRDVDAVVAHLSAAVRSFAAAGEPCRAAMACLRLGDVLENAMGNLTAARAWFARARRMVADLPPCPEQGWVAVAAMGCDVDDPAELLASAELALDRARRFGDVNLETKALADAGLAHVQSGRFVEGMAMLDEAMALACGPANDEATTAKSVCSFFTACYHAADFERADSWAELFRRHGLIASEPGGPAFLSSHCDSVQATMLVELGRWGEAEALLERAAAAFEALMGTPSWHPDIALADLRVRQGRYLEAEALLLGKDQSMQALLPAARLHLARGDHELARAAARRGLRAVRADRLRAVELLTVLVDAELAAGDIPAAVTVCDQLRDRLGDLDVPALRARAEAAHVRVLAAQGDVGGARAAAEALVERLDPRRLPFERAVALVDLARRRDEAGDRHGAVVDARAAAALLAGLDVVLPPADLALVERLVSSDGTRALRTATLTRHGKWWVVASDGTSVRLPDTKGLRYVAALVAAPGVERHALDLVDQVDGVAANGEIDRRSLGDAGALSDARARASYRRRIEDLRAAADDAIADGRLDAAERAQAEIDELVRELARAFGLGGRDRRAASVVERARLNVTRAVRTAISRLVDVVPEPSAVLDRRVRTGTYCVFEPDPGDEYRWIVGAD